LAECKAKSQNGKLWQSARLKLAAIAVVLTDQRLPLFNLMDQGQGPQEDGRRIFVSYLTQRLQGLATFRQHAYDIAKLPAEHKCFRWCCDHIVRGGNKAKGITQPHTKRD